MNRMLYALLVVVAAAAAVLSFDALLGLAALCGFRPTLAWLLPITVDAGAAGGSLVWLTRPAGAARAFGRVLALVLLAGSVAGNALGHGLVAYGATPAWWVVVAVSAVPPAVLGAVVHLAVLAGRHPAPPAEAVTPRTVAEAVQASHTLDSTGGAHEARTPALDPIDAGVGNDDRVGELIASGAGRRRLARELEISEHAARELLEQRRNGHRAVSS